jgi:hypothetical protein
MCDGATGNTFTGNTFQGPVIGLEIDVMAHETVTANHFTGNLAGIRVVPYDRATADVITGNTITGTGWIGIQVDDRAGEPLTLLVKDNTVTHSGTNTGSAGDSGHNPVDGGIHIYAPHGTVTLTGNHTSASTGYGIWSYADGATGTGNTSTGDEHGCQPAALCA